MTWHVLESWWLLLRFELIMKFRKFRELHRIVKTTAVHSIDVDDQPAHHLLCRAMDLACVFYFKQVMCLQRSAATTLLLRRHGWKAEMVIGTQIVPFKSHAWVEVVGAVVNDRADALIGYRVLERS